MASTGNAALLNTYQAIVSTFCDFLTVAIHTILYERHIYPASSFLSARKYNFPVRQNRHPKVCKWIQDAVTAVEIELLKGTVARTAVVIYSPTSAPLERFMFDVSSFPVVPAAESLTPFERSSDDNNESDESTSPQTAVVDLEEQFRGVMSKLAFCGAALGTLPENCSFTVCIELKHKVDPPIGHPQSWIPAQPNLQPANNGKEKEEKDKRRKLDSDKGTALGGVNITPVRSVEAGDFLLEMWIEEGKAKIGDKKGLEREKETYEDPP
ncbi:MAG: hypothetical protein M1827_002434 [Pycnora praestabilis]|nr:MAG: hypothetical protein M1827_002434 [Pycnora praestabilis]